MEAIVCPLFAPFLLSLRAGALALRPPRRSIFPHVFRSHFFLFAPVSHHPAYARLLQVTSGKFPDSAEGAEIVVALLSRFFHVFSTLLSHVLTEDSFPFLTVARLKVFPPPFFEVFELSGAPTIELDPPRYCHRSPLGFSGPQNYCRVRSLQARMMGAPRWILSTSCALPYLLSHCRDDLSAGASVLIGFGRNGSCSISRGSWFAFVASYSPFNSSSFGAIRLCFYCPSDAIRSSIPVFRSTLDQRFLAEGT